MLVDTVLPTKEFLCRGKTPPHTLTPLGQRFGNDRNARLGGGLGSLLSKKTMFALESFLFGNAEFLGGITVVPNSVKTVPLELVWGS